jgi:flagellar hook-associated protein 1 FlgK
MSISGSMSSALSGLTVAARSAEVISSNIANALTEGYGRRELQIAARQVGDSGQGVKVTGITRDVNQVLLGDRRMADAQAANLDRHASFLKRLETVIGTPESGASLNGRIAAFDTALIAAAAQPASPIRHADLANTARAVTTTFKNISSEIQTSRSEADTRIAAEVYEVNRALSTIAELNRSITIATGGGRDGSALIDQRQQLIDKVAKIIPIREVPQDFGRVSLFTAGGAALLDRTAATLEFRPTGIITPEMTVASGGLSGLTLNGRAVDTGPGGQIAGGSMAADFAIRDSVAPNAQTEMDAVARDLVSRFQDVGLDPTLGVKDPGLFTDDGAHFDPASEVGLAARISLNAAVDPEKGGDLWRLRDGINAIMPGPAGQSSLFTAMQSALTEARTTSSGQHAGSTRSLSSLSGQMISVVATNRLSTEMDAGFAAARATALQNLELEGGVDTDRELQNLLMVEKAYAANAKVIQTVDDMLQVLLGL